MPPPVSRDAEARLFRRHFGRSTSSNTGMLGMATAHYIWIKVHADNLTVSLRQFENLRAHSVWLIIEATKAISDVDPGQVTTTVPQIGGIFVDAVQGRTNDL